VTENDAAFSMKQEPQSRWGLLLRALLLRVLLLPLVADLPSPSLVSVDSGVKSGSTGLITPGDVYINKLTLPSHRYRSNAEFLHKTVGGFFTAGETAQAKQVLVHKFLGLVKDTSHVAERRESSTRSVSDADAEDIICLFDIVDEGGMLDEVVFCRLKSEHAAHRISSEILV
jgi:hypothetical protein